MQALHTHKPNQVLKCQQFLDLPGASLVTQQVKESTCNAGATGDMSSIPGSERSPGGGRGSPLQHSCLENPMDREAWQAIVQRLKEVSMTVSDLARTHGGTVDKNLPVDTGEAGWIPGLERCHKPQTTKARAPQKLSPHSGACELRLLSPCALELRPPPPPKKNQQFLSWLMTLW